MNTYTVIVPDNDILQRVCGTNDSNLKLIESFLGVNVFARGNELSVDTSDSDVSDRFKFIIDRLLDEMSCSSMTLSDSELVKSVLNARSFSPRITGDFSASEIVIPGAVRKVYPRTKGQAELVSLMRSSNLVFAEGPAGSGKTFLAVAESLRLLLSHEVNSIVLTRPVVEAGESLGYLPGALEDKINPYIRPLFDAMNFLLPRETVKRLVESGAVEIAPLAYMRGRTLTNCAVILDEAQNTTSSQMKMFLTRLGDSSKMFVTGDTSQTDLPKKIPSGLSEALHVLKNVSGIAIKKLSASDVVRNDLVRKIIQAYENEER
ncbi:MAG: PhoH family protein [Treponema sp.]|nr:PhoH family protein [Treponema sp.]